MPPRTTNYISMLSRMYKQLQTLLVLFTLLFSFAELSAQTCDENISKALEQTRITTFAQVTQGATGKFVIRYPLAGTKYTLRDQAGNTYDYTYTGNPVQIAITIPVGAVTTARSFSFTAENGSCSYSSGFDYTITPQTTTGLSVRVENEWCERGGGIFFQLIGTGVNESDYTFYYKKSSETDYDYTKQLSPSTGIEAIVAGSYDLIAKHKTETSKNIEKKNILIQSTVETVEYNLIYAPAICAGSNGDIRVNVTKGKYPLFFSLLKEDGTPYSTATTRQTSNIFKNIPVGEYKVRVEDFCAIGGGNAPLPQAVSVKDFNFNLKRIDSVKAWEYGCNYVNFASIWLEVEHLAEILAADALPYPFSIQLLFESPTHQTYTKTITISNRREFDIEFGIVKQNDVEKFLSLRKYIREGYPVEYGTWKMKAKLISRCGTTDVAEEQTIVTDPFDEIDVTTAVKGTSCRSIAIVRNTIYSVASSADTNIPVYFVLESYPNNFDPEAAGFYKINTTHPSLINKYVKRFDYNGPNLVDPEFLNTGDKFKFKAVYDSCNREKTLPEITIPANAAAPSQIYISAAGTCKDVSATGTDYATMVIDQRSGSPITKVVIKNNTTADTSKLPAGMTLPYTLKDSEHITNNYWMVKDLPKGKYTIEYTNACGAVDSREFELIGDIYSITWQEGCIPKFKFKHTSTQYKNFTSFAIQRYDETTQSWKQVDYFTPNLNQQYEYSILGNARGKFRLVRLVQAYNRYVNINKNLLDCEQVISEKEFVSTMEKPKVFGLGCPSTNVHHVLVVPQGGVPPYTYKLVSKEIAGHSPQVLNQIGNDNNFFLNLDASNTTARYVFQVTDACGEAKTVDYRVSNFVVPSLTAEQEFYCTGQSARLSIPKMGNNMRIDWYRSDKTVPVATNTNTLYIASLTEADFNNTYSVKLTGNYDPDVNACVAAATIQAYQFKRRVVNNPSFTMPVNTPVIKCVNSSYSEEFDLNTMFNKPAALTTYLSNNPAVKVKITDEAGALVIPDNAKVDLTSADFISKTHTIVYTLESPCGQKLLEAKNSLTVNNQINIYTDDNVKLCGTNPTYDEVAQYIKDKNNIVKTSLVIFNWYPTLADAEAKTNKQIGTASIGNISETTPKTLYLRYSKLGFCDSNVMTIQVKKTSTATPTVQNLGTVCAVTVEALKKLIDPTDFANVVIYHNNNVLVNDYSLSNDSQIFYAKKIGTCETGKAKVNFTTKAVTQAAPQSVSLCATTDQYGNLIISNEKIKTALKAIYPTVETNEIKLYKKIDYQESFTEYTTTLVPVNQVLYFTIKESNKCISSYYRLTLSANSNQITAPSVTALLCPDATIADLRTAISGAHTIKIYNQDTEQTNTMSIDWNKADKYTYTLVQAGNCESFKGLITLIKSNNVTPITPKAVNLCGGVAHTIATIKAQLGDSSAKVYLKNGNNYDEQADNTTVNTALTYYYTIKEASKCTSEKAPITLTITQSTPTPQGPNSTTGCIKTVGDLRSYIRTNDPSRSTDDLAIYAGLLDTDKGPALADATVLTKTTYSYAYTTAGKCESAVRHITITPSTGGNETLNLQGSNNSLSCIPTGQLRFQIQRPQAGRTYVVVLTEVPATYTGTRTFTVTETDKDGTTPFVKFTGYNMPDGAYKARLITCNTANGNPVPATVNRMPRDFPAPNRSNNDFGTDQAYRDIQSGGKPDCGYMDIRYSNNTNSPFYRYFNTPELAALYEYTAYSDDDLANKYGGNRNHSDIVWRDLFSLPTGKTSVIQNVLYYDLAYHNHTYKDLKEDTKKPKFYFRIKGQNCNNNNAPMLIGANGMSFMNTGIVFGGTCQNPEMSVTAENQMVCYPVKYVINENGTKVAEGEITYATERKNVTTLASGQTFKRNQRYQVVFTSQDGQVQTQTDSFDDFYNKMRPGGEYKEQARCFGSNEAPKGNIQVFHRVNQSGTIFSMNGFKVTLLEAPTGYTNEPGKLRLNETVTIQYTDPTKRTTNIMATERQDDMTQMFSLPEGTYKIRVEDPCGNVTYLYSGRNATKQEFDLSYVPYQEKALTPKVETECTKVRVYPFKNNPAFDWLKINNQKKNIYVYLFKRPTGITDGDIAVSSNLSEVIGGTRYVKAVFKPNEANSDNQYFSLPRNQNSEGSYTFIYGAKIGAVGREEQELINYISSNGTNGCVRTFTISVDDVLLNFDRDSYIGYKCEDNTGKIVIKAINGISGTGTYQYELYDRKDGTRIHTQTAAKGSTVTFTNLGTFSAGQNTRWVKIIDSECPTDPVWKELPITPLDNPELVLASPLQSGYCKGSTVTITLRSLGAPSYQWKYPDGTTTVTTLPQLVIPSIDAQHAGIYQVVAQGLVCAANTVTFSYTVNILEAPATGKTYTLCAAATVADLKAKIATDTATVRVYKNGTLVTDNTEALSTTDTYKVSRFNAVCETDKVVVTIVFSNTVTLTVPTALTVTCTATNIDTVVSNWLNQATVTDTCGTATLTHNFTAVKPTNWCGAGVVTVTFVARDPQGNTVTKTSLIKVGNTPLVATPDTDFTFPSGSVTGTSTRTVIDNDRIGNRTPTTSDVVITTGTTTTDVVGQTNTPTIDTTTGKVTVPAGTKSGTYTLTYTICERLNPDNCKTTTVTVKVGNTTTPTTIEANDDVATVSSTTGGTTSSVLTNDKLNGVPNPSVSSVTLTWTTATPTGFTLNPNGTITIAPNTPAGTYTISYKICAVASSTVCDNANIVVTVTGTTTSTTPVLPIAADDRTTTPIDTPIVVNVLANDTPNGATAPNVVTNPTNGTTVVNPDGTIEYRPHTGFEGIDTFVYELCNTDGCASATVTIEVISKLIPYNGMSVDDDGKNEHFHIGGINRYPDNVVRIYNRWGVKVFEAEGYNNVTRVFRGFSNGRVVVETSDKLPQGTYYYVIEYVDENKQKRSEVGWLYLKR